MFVLVSVLIGSEDIQGQESSPSNAPPNPVGVVATVSILVWKSMEMDPEKGLDANEFLPQVHWQEL